MCDIFSLPLLLNFSSEKLEPLNEKDYCLPCCMFFVYQLCKLQVPFSNILIILNIITLHMKGFCTVKSRMQLGSLEKQLHFSANIAVRLRSGFETVKLSCQMDQLVYLVH